ncbi:MAG TPA: hypothetical protein VJM49_19605 [Acidimicrobiales bacterium]|nr:hypothetical protein [Acidimicrobiales bacterium]
MSDALSPTLACTICGSSSFAKLRLEITAGAATYLVCAKPGCINEAVERARDNLGRAAGRARRVDVIETTVVDAHTELTSDEHR